MLQPPSLLRPVRPARSRHPKSSELAQLLRDYPVGLPELTGSPISVSALPQLTASRGRLLSRSPHHGTAVYAASFIRQRRIVLDSAILRSPATFRLILVHEIFHFVWARLSNSKRAVYADLLDREWAHGARGELGESADAKKSLRPVPASRLWRDYVCESFCDTAAFVYAGIQRHSMFTLAPRWTEPRREWFHRTFEAGCRC